MKPGAFQPLNTYHQTSSMIMNVPTQVFRVLAVGWMALIFYMSSQPSLPMPQFLWSPDKILHAIVFGILAFLFVRSLAPPHVTTWRRVWLVTLAVALYGLIDEYHQAFVPGRDGSMYDALADALGGLAVSVSLYWRGRSVMAPA